MLKPWSLKNIHNCILNPANINKNNILSHATLMNNNSFSFHGQKIETVILSYFTQTPLIYLTELMQVWLVCQRQHQSTSSFQVFVQESNTNSIFDYWLIDYQATLNAQHSWVIVELLTKYHIYWSTNIQGADINSSSKDIKLQLSIFPEVYHNPLQQTVLCCSACVRSASLTHHNPRYTHRHVYKSASGSMLLLP